MCERFGITLPLSRGVVMRLRYTDSDGDVITLAYPPQPCTHLLLLHHHSRPRVERYKCLRALNTSPLLITAKQSFLNRELYRADRGGSRCGCATPTPTAISSPSRIYTHPASCFLSHTPSLLWWVWVCSVLAALRKGGRAGGHHFFSCFASLRTC